MESIDGNAKIYHGSSKKYTKLLNRQRMQGEKNLEKNIDAEKTDGSLITKRKRVVSTEISKDLDPSNKK